MDHQNHSQTLRRKTMKVCPFTLMLVGQSGLGKTSFVNTLYNDRVIPEHHESAELKEEDLHQVAPIKFIPYMIEREEFGHKLSMTIVDTPGFGDSLNNEPGCHAILRYIEDQFDHVLSEESRIKRNPKFQDTRIHVLLYFIAPTGHSLKELDIMLMKTVGKRVNIIPVIAKSDALTPDELAQFKKRIMEDIHKHGIPTYNFPCETDEDADQIAENEELRALLPFAIVGAETETLGRDAKKRGRKYPWGFMEVDNPNHCDFAKLRAVLLSSHFQDLKDITQDVLYENYRTEKLSQESNSRSVEPHKAASAEPLTSPKSSQLKGSKDPNSVRLEIEKKLRDRKDRDQDAAPELPTRTRSPVPSQ